MKRQDGWEYWQKRLATGRGGEKKVTRDLTLYQAGDTLVFDHYDKTLMTLTQDDVYTLHLEGHYISPTVSNRLYTICGINIYADASRYKHYANQLRYTPSGKRWHQEGEGPDSKWVKCDTIPVVSGMKFKDGDCINPEICVDYVRRLNREKALPFRRKMDALGKVIRVAARLNVMQKPEGKFDFADVNIDDPTVRDGEIILWKGHSHYEWMSNPNSWWSQRMTPEQKAEYMRKAVETAYSNFREWLYEQNGCYEMVRVETTKDEPLPLAA
jgi:hypothetical protein